MFQGPVQGELRGGVFPLDPAAEPRQDVREDEGITHQEAGKEIRIQIFKSYVFIKKSFVEIGSTVFIFFSLFYHCGSIQGQGSRKETPKIDF